MSPERSDTPELEELRQKISELERQVTAHRRSERWLRARDAAAGVLVSASSLADAARPLLQGIGEALGWQHGALWKVESRWNVLRCIATWRESSAGRSEFEEVTRRRTFASGVGLPGRVWATRQPAWLSRPADDENFPRAPIARKEGLKSGFAFPVKLNSEVYAVIEFFSREDETPDDDFLRAFETFGHQMGQFVRRTRADETLDRFFTLSLDLLCIAGFDGVFRRLNPVWQSVLGYTLEDLTTTPFLDFVHPEDQAATLEEMEKLTAGASTVAFENRYRTRDGSYRWLMWTAAPFGGGQLIYATARDVTERREMEQELKRLREVAEAASAAKTEFLARMSHEIRTPMNAVVGIADLLWDSTLGPEQREYVRILRRAGNNLLDLINDILDLSKIEAGGMEIASVEFDLSDVVERALEITAVQAHEKGLELVSQVEPDVPLDLTGDPHRLRQVLLNLLGNAVKFTEQGEVVLRVEREPDSPAGLRFSVSDTGIGIPAAKHATIFEKFTQADTSTTRTHGGTGLGLAISQRLVALMGGHLQVESEPGRGSTFFFSLALAPASRPFRTSASATVDLKDLKTLIVDDNATNRLILRQILASWGAAVDEARDGRDAIAEIARARDDGSPYGLVLLDCRMPHIDGFGVAEHIRRDSSTAAPVVLMLTSDNRAGDAARSRELGIPAYLVKPVRRRDLLEAIQAALEPESAARPAVSPEPPAEPPAAPLQLRILVAEDSEDNVVLLRSFLKDSGCHLDFAANGEEAVARFTEGDYDLVLMDVQMPIVDGYDATERIRAWERERGLDPVPVIALTAYALPAEQQRSRQAGCTAHLAKPVRQQTLLAAIRKHGAIEVRVPVRLADVIPWYLDRQRSGATNLLASLDAGDFESIGMIGHRMKGSGSGYGLDRISEIGAAIEEAAARWDSTTIRRQAEALDTFLRRVAIVYG